MAVAVVNNDMLISSSAASTSRVEVRSVWAHNLDEEFSLIRSALPFHPFVALDTEYPGVVVTSKGPYCTLTLPQRYDLIRANVEALRIVQVGLTLSDAAGNLPCALYSDGTYVRYVWEFNFRDFDISRDRYAPSSVELLKANGIDFQKNQIWGIDSCRFAQHLATSGLLSFGHFSPVSWVTFQGAYDFAFLVKMLTCDCELPKTVREFLHHVHFFFGKRVFDVKHLSKHCRGLYGGLERVASTVQVERAVGSRHQSGSDSLLTWQDVSTSQVAVPEGNPPELPTIVELSSPSASEKSPSETPTKKKRKLTLAPPPKQKSVSHSENLPPVDVVPSSPDIPLSALYLALVPSSSATPAIPNGWIYNMSITHLLHILIQENATLKKQVSELSPDQTEIEQSLQYKADVESLQSQRLSANDRGDELSSKLEKYTSEIVQLSFQLQSLKDTHATTLVEQLSTLNLKEATLKASPEELAAYKASEDGRFEKKKEYLKSLAFLVPVSDSLIRTVNYTLDWGGGGVRELKELKVLVSNPPPGFPDQRKLLKGHPLGLFPQLL
ncbi:hypothetical protein ZIOFF_073465 [Zingiber officinale]|uniref:poly(A)-specific ribonuclease n=1 Tax=Zingiber officinale TaxID=94328 RepID=A0A8J5C5Q0_ZINOF|nr:hypothetical protein ZIOFF_073465 [Zingiber officinale]